MELVAIIYLMPILIYLLALWLAAYLGFTKLIFKFGDFFIVFCVTAFFSYRFLENISYDNKVRFISCIVIGLVFAFGMYYGLLYLNRFKKAYWFLMGYHFIASIINSVLGMFVVISLFDIPHKPTYHIYEFLIFKNAIANTIINYIIVFTVGYLMFRIRKEELIVDPYERYLIEKEVEDFFNDNEEF